jgi:DNA-binding transcriptional LysR family regulator
MLDTRLFKRIDLQLLACLDALVDERSVTRAAQRLDMSQPAMSAALAKLRELLQDALLVRTSKGMVPTPRALEVAQSIRIHLRGLESAIAATDPFDPTTAKDQIRIATTDFTGTLLLPLVAHHLSQQAPGMSVLVRLPDPSRIGEWLQEGECDLAVGFFPELADDLRVSSLFTDTLSCIARRGSRGSPPVLSLADYQSAHHVLFGSPFAPISTIESLVNRTLNHIGVVRHTSIEVPSILLPAYIVAQSDLLATLPSRLAHRFTATHPVDVVDLPFEAPSLNFTMVWHERSHPVAAHRWVRSVIHQAVSELTG